MSDVKFNNFRTLRWPFFVQRGRTVQTMALAKIGRKEESWSKRTDEKLFKKRAHEREFWAKNLH